MKLSQGLVVLGVVLAGALLFGAYSAASAPLPDGFPAPTADGEIEVKQYRLTGRRRLRSKEIWDRHLLEGLRRCFVILVTTTSQ